MLIDHFVQYIVETRGISQSSVKHYVQALYAINDLLDKNGFIVKDIFTLSTINSIELVEEFLNNNPEFRLKDKLGHRMYSVAFRHYRRFILWYYQ